MKEDDRLVCFLIVNFNGSEVLDQCLQSVLNQDYRQVAIVVVDNGSTDHSRHIVRQYTPKVTLIDLDKNYGYAKANNHGLRHILKTDAEYIAFINTDVVLNPRWLDSLVQFLSLRNFDFAQSIIIDYLNSHVIDSLGIGISRDLSIYDRSRGTELSSVKEHSQNIFGPCFAASIFKREVIEQVTTDQGFFDETFHSFYDDVDCCFRANFLGFRGGLFPEPLCRHRRSFTADQMPFQKHLFIGRNYWLVLRKYIPLKWIARKSSYVLLKQSFFILQNIGHPKRFIGSMVGTISGVILLLEGSLCFKESIRRDDLKRQEVIHHILEGHYE